MTLSKNSEAVGNEAVLRSAEELDALDAILPFDRRDQLTELLTDGSGGFACRGSR